MDGRHKTDGLIQCLTLAPVVRLQARKANAEDKEWLASCLFHLRQPSTGSMEGDITKLGDLIEGYVLNLLSTNFSTLCLLLYLSLAFVMYYVPPDLTKRLILCGCIVGRIG